jgi:hypothetical protein
VELLSKYACIIKVASLPILLAGSSNPDDQIEIKMDDPQETIESVQLPLHNKANHEIMAPTELASSPILLAR